MILRRLLPAAVCTLALAAIAAGQGVATPPSPRLAVPGQLPNDSQPAGPETPLMPDQTPSLVKPEGAPSDPEKSDTKKAKASKTETFEKDLLQKIRFRQVHSQALGDREVQAAWDKSLTTRTDAEKRLALKQFYKLLYARMAKLDTTLKAQITLRALEADHRLTQTRLTPAELSAESERTFGAGQE